MNRFSFQLACFLLAVLILVTGMSACTPVTETPSLIASEIIPTDIPSTDVKVSFSVSIPLESDSEGDLYLEIINDPVGSGGNAQRYPIAKTDGGTWQTTLSLARGSLLQYRYLLVTGQEVWIEHTPIGEPVVYRRYYVGMPGEVHDIVSAWDSRESITPAGQLIGWVTDQYDTPLHDMLVTAGGLRTISSADGFFQLEGLPAGLHNLVVSSIHGTTIAFQQGAVIEANAITPATVVVQKTDPVRIAFLLEEPDISAKDAHIRLIGNLYETGNNFTANLNTYDTDFSRAPEMIRLDDGRFVITLTLPVGFDLHYQYTMGDTFINTELNASGELITHRLIIPETDTTITDRISAWTSDNSQPVEFLVTVPGETPSTDFVSIQFDFDGWRSPLPMRLVSENIWTFTLYHPLPAEKLLTYRYCRNMACNAASAEVVNNGPAEQTIHIAGDEKILVQDSIQSWMWLLPTDEQTTIIGSPVWPRGPNFMAGIELQNLQKEGSLGTYSAAFENISSIGANWVVLTPTWRFTDINPPRLELVAGEDLFTSDVEELIHTARENDLQVALFPRILLNDSAEAWWISADRDGFWWDTLFGQMRTFYRHFAWLAQENGIPVLVIGDPSMTPAYPEGKLPSGTPSSVFSDAEERWTTLVREIRTLYQGWLMFAANDTAFTSFSPEYYQMFDAIYLLVDTPLNVADVSNQDLSHSVGLFLETQVLPFSETVQRDVILALNYPSHPDAVMGCVETDNDCIGFETLAATDGADQNYTKIENNTSEGMPDYTIQYKIYESFLRAINKNEQIMGLVSRGFYAPVERHDFSASVRGKPAAALLWYWFPRFVLSEQQ